MGQESTTFSVRMDTDVKKGLDSFCAAVGMNTNTAINMFARVVYRENRLPFDVAIDPFYSQANIELLKKSIAQLESSGGTLHEVDYDG